MRNGRTRLRIEQNKTILVGVRGGAEEGLGGERTGGRGDDEGGTWDDYSNFLLAISLDNHEEDKVGGRQKESHFHPGKIPEKMSKFRQEAG